MSARDCPSLEQLATLAAMPAGDPRRAHVDACPRCLGLLASYGLFMEGRAAEGARPDEADAVLAAAFERELSPARPAPLPRSSSWLALLFAPALRPAWALAAVALVAFAVWRFGHAPGAPLLRGAREATVRIETLPPETSADSLVLRWKSAAGAASYEVRFFAMDLSKLAAAPTGAATTLTLRRGALPDGLPAHTRVLWQVVALRGQDILARSRTQPVDLP